MAFKGITTGMYRMKYQDWLFDVNDELDKRFADDEIAKQMNLEHPTAKKIPAEDVRGIRTHYNAGRQGHGPPRNERMSYPYDENKQQYRYPKEGWRRDDKNL